MKKNFENNELKNWYAENFKTYENKLNGESKSYIHGLRKAALEKLKDLNFPTTRNEEWKYTDVSPVLKHNFLPAVNMQIPKLELNEISKFLFKDFECTRLVFVNGMFNASLSDNEIKNKNVFAGSLNNFSKAHPEIFADYFNKLIKDINAFNALNTAYAADGLAVYVPNEVVLEKPIQALFINTSEEEFLTSPRNLIIAGKNSEVKIIASHVGFGGTTYFNNVVTEIFVGESGIAEFYKIQNEDDNSFHIEKLEAEQKDKSLFNHFNLTFGGALVRNDINTVLNGENIETHYYGLSLGSGSQHIDNHTFVDHAKPNCMSNELYKSILDDKSRGVFNGKIIVRKDAQKTNAYQQNKTVLLSKTASIDSKPQLEIFADDVKCSHGATVGHLDEISEFYIRSRGVPQELAKSMLIRAFANDVIESVRIEPLKEQLNHMIFQHLHKVEIEN